MISTLRHYVAAVTYRFLGRLFRKRGHHALARRFFAEASAIDGEDLDSLFEHARASWVEGDSIHARELVDKLLHVDSRHAQGLNLSGALLLAEGKLDVAESRFFESISSDPELAAPYNNLGNIYQEREDFARAETFYRHAVARDPSNVEAWSNLGAVLNRLIRYQEAERICRHALTLDPEHPGAINNLANALHSQGRIGEAVKQYREALRLKPGLIEAHINLSVVLYEPAHLIPAIDHYLHLVEQKPESFVAQIRLGQAFMAQGDYDRAEGYLRRALEIRPAAADAMMVLANCLGAQALQADSKELVRKSLWFGSGMGAHTSFLFSMLYLPDASAADIYRESREWAILYAESQLPFPDLRRWNPAPRAGRKLRVGYISRDFCRHSVGYFIEPILEHHDRSRFEIFCYSNLFQGDAVTERFKELADGWREIAFLSDEDVCRRIEDDAIDILVDLSGQTSGYRPLVMARKPAPVQVNYIGYPATTGLRAIDYRIVDEITDPPGDADRFHSESLYRLRRCFLAYRPPADAPDVSPLPMDRRDHITFGCFNNLSKLNAQVIRCWSRILGLLPDSRLLLKGFSFSSGKTRAHILGLFETEGIHAERITLAGWHPEARGHLDLYGEIDVALDPFPYNGTTTTCEAMWMGVPVITYVGSRHSARVGASLLTAVGLQELIAASEDAYVDQAIRLAGDRPRLRRLRAELRDMVRMSPLFDANGAAREVERAYEAMWADWESRHETAGLPSTRQELLTLRLSAGEKICLPDSLDLMTRYVVEEYGDWFEPETKFVRQYLCAGMGAMDIGANYGVYTLAMASAVGSAGLVWSYEPALEVANALMSSLHENGFEHVVLEQAAVAEKAGSVRLVTRGGPELAQIALDAGTSGITVEARTLDGWHALNSAASLALIKVDAEGQEAAIVRGGRKLLASQSPLIMAEYMNGHERNDSMLVEFQSLGYLPYRLVPALGLLEPIVAEELKSMQAPPLNLFFCKPDLAAALLTRSLMVGPDKGFGDASGDDSANRELVAAYFLRKPFAQSWREEWAKWLDDSDGKVMLRLRALAAYANSANLELPPAQRYGWLQRANALLDEIQDDASVSVRLVKARVLGDLGKTSLSATILHQVLVDLLSAKELDWSPFLAPSPRFDDLAPVLGAEEWLLAACQDQLEALGTFSAYFTPAESLSRLRDIRDLGYASAETRRRIELILQRFDRRWTSAGSRREN